MVDAVLASLGTDSYSFPSDFVRSVVATEPSQVAAEMAALGQKLYCTERSGVSSWVARISRVSLSVLEAPYSHATFFNVSLLQINKLVFVGHLNFQESVVSITLTLGQKTEVS